MILQSHRKKQFRQLIYVTGILIIAVAVGSAVSYFRIRKEQAKTNTALARAESERDKAEKARADEILARKDAENQKKLLKRHGTKQVQKHAEQKLSRILSRKPWAQ